MRVLIATDPNEFRHGYVNLHDGEDPQTGASITASVNSLLDFGDHVLAGEANEVLVPSAIDFVPPDEAHRYLAYWGSRIARDGRLAVTGLDLLSVSYMVDSGGMPLEEARKVLFSTGRRAAYSAEELRLMVESVGLVVETVTAGKIHYTLVATRPQEV